MEDNYIIKNLGQVSIVFKGQTPPDNKDLIWIDTTSNPAVKKVYDPVSCIWESMTPENIIEQFIVQQTTAGETSFTFTHDLQQAGYNYMVQIDLEDVDGFLILTPDTILKRANDVLITFSVAPTSSRAIRCIIHHK